MFSSSCIYFSLSSAIWRFQFVCMSLTQLSYMGTILSKASKSLTKAPGEKSHSVQFCPSTSSDLALTYELTLPLIGLSSINLESSNALESVVEAANSGSVTG